MTSKEALKSYVQSNEPIYPSDRAYNIIEKDLEVLEILKNKSLSELHKELIIGSRDFDDYSMEYDLSFEKYCREINPQKYNEIEFNKIKEWLENGI